MKKIILVLINFFCLLSICYSQNGWFTQETGIRYIKDIEFINELTGFACGDTGRIIKTTDGGNSWTLVYHTNYSLTSLDFINANTGVVSGYLTNGGFLDTALVLKTTDSGSRFEISLKLPYMLHEILYGSNVQMINENSVFVAYNAGNGSAATGSFLRSQNGGSNWMLLGMIPIVELNFVNETTGWAYSAFGNDIGYREKAVFKTTSAGLMWEKLYKDTLPNSSQYSITAFDENNVYLVGGQKKFIKTSNGGMNWISSDLNPAITNINDAFFLNQNTGWFISSFAGTRNIHKTTNSGNSWIVQPFDSVWAINQMFFINEWTGWVGGWQYNSNKTLMKTVTGGIMTISNESNINYGFKLFTNYPNPFNPVTKIQFSIPQKENVRLSLYNNLGQEIAVLINDIKNAGTYEYTFNGENYSSGIYFYKIQSGSFTDTKRMVLVK